MGFSLSLLFSSFFKHHLSYLSPPPAPTTTTTTTTTTITTKTKTTAATTITTACRLRLLPPRPHAAKMPAYFVIAGFVVAGLACIGIWLGAFIGGKLFLMLQNFYQA